MLLSSVDCFRMIIRRIHPGFLKIGLIFQIDCSACEFSILIFVDGAHVRAVIAGEQSG